MAGKHRKRSRHARKFTAIGAATATATALTIGIPPEPKADAAEPKAVDANVDLMAAINPWPQPDQIPDLTGGLGTAGYDFTQTVLELVIRAVVENINLAALAQAAGLDLNSLVDGLLGDPDFLLNEVLGGVLGEIPIDLSPALDEIVGGLVTDTVLIPVLQLLGITDGNGVTDLLSLLGLVGLDLSDPLNLANLDVPGLNVITAGPAFTLLKLLGVDLGWVPGLPNAVANEINGTDYLEVGANGLLNTLLDELTETLPGNPLIPLLQGVIDGLTSGLPDVVHLRVPVTVGIGMGAFAVATAYEKVLADLPNQPGGVNYEGTNPLLGSITVLPMLMLFNPARPNGGALARFYPLFGLLGINTVNPETEVSSSGGFLQLPLGLSLGGANLIPILIDVGIQYHPSSDLAAWPNPVSLANNLMAGLLPTYILRGITLDTVPEQLTTQITEALENVLEGNPLALNLYVTLPSATPPLLEPLYLAADLVNLMTLGAASQFNPFSLVANAFAPALLSMINLGYTDVVFNPVTGAYERTLTEAGDPTPFMSFPDVNWGQVPGVVINQLLQGIQKEFLSGNPTPGTPNVILNLLNFLGGDLLGGLGPLGDLGGLLQGILDGLNPLALTQQATTLAAATDVPDADARMLTLSTEAVEDESQSATVDSGATAPTEEETAEVEVTEEEVAEEDATEEDATEEDAADEEAADEDAADEDAADEDAADEDAADEDAADEDEADEDAADDDEADDDEADDDEADDDEADDDANGSTTPNQSTPGNNSPSNDNTNAGTDSDSDSDSDGGSSDNAAA